MCKEKNVRKKIVRKEIQSRKKILNEVVWKEIKEKVNRGEEIGILRKEKNISKRKVRS